MLLILITLFVFYPALDHDFVNYDDPVYVTENSHVTGGITAGSIGWAFTEMRHANFWHPLTWISHILDCQLYGLNPRGHHASGLFLHGINTVLLFWVLRGMTGSLWKSAFVAALFGVHPLHVESVAWVAERKDVLSTLFWMLTMIAYWRYARKGSGYAWVMVFFTLGLMAKPMLVTLPFVLMLMDYWPLRRWQGNALACAREKMPLLVLAGIASAVAYLAQHWGGALASGENFPLWVRVANALGDSAGYVGKMFWPVDLAAFYPHPGMDVSITRAVTGGLLLAVVSMAVFWQRRRHPYLLVGWFWFLGTLLPVIGLIPLGMHGMADRYSYVPLIGLFIMVGWGGAELFEKLYLSRVLRWGLACAALGMLMVVARVQVGYWSDGVRLFEHAVAVTPQSPKSLNVLGDAYCRGDRFTEGIARYRMALRMAPASAEIHFNLANALAGIGSEEEALGHYEQALQLSPQNVDMHNNLGILLARQGKTSEAIAHYAEALKIDPSYVKARVNMQIALAMQGRGIDPAERPYRLGIAMARQGRPKEAIANFSEALRLRPDFSQAHYNLGVVLAKEGRREEAKIQFNAALRSQPDHAQARMNLLKINGGD